MISRSPPPVRVRGGLATAAPHLAGACERFGRAVSGAFVMVRGRRCGVKGIGSEACFRGLRVEASPCGGAC